MRNVFEGWESYEYLLYDALPNSESNYMWLFFLCIQEAMDSDGS